MHEIAVRKLKKNKSLRNKSEAFMLPLMLMNISGVIRYED